MSLIIYITLPASKILLKGCNSHQHFYWEPRAKFSGQDEKNDVGASDAYGVSRDDYINFVCGLKDIYCKSGTIFERVEQIDNFKEKHPELQYVENKLLNYYKTYDSIIDVLMFNIQFSFEDLANFHYRDEGYLKQIFGINTRVEKSLLSSGYRIAEDVICLKKEQLMEFDGVGSKSAGKILNKIKDVKSSVSSNILIT